MPSQPASPDLPAAPDGAKWAAAPRYTERLHFRRDTVGLTDRGYRHLFVVDAEGGAPRQITSGEWSLGSALFEIGDGAEWRYMPDGRSAIVEGYKEGDGDLNNRQGYLYSVDLETGATKRLITATGGWNKPSVSPDGKTIAFLGFTQLGDSYRVADLYIMSADGSNATLRSGGFRSRTAGIGMVARRQHALLPAERQGQRSPVCMVGSRRCACRHQRQTRS